MQLTTSTHLLLLVYWLYHMNCSTCLKSTIILARPDGLISTDMGEHLMFGGIWSRVSGPHTVRELVQAYMASIISQPFSKQEPMLGPMAGRRDAPRAPISAPWSSMWHTRLTLSMSGWLSLHAMSYTFTGSIHDSGDSTYGQNTHLSQYSLGKSLE